MHKRRFLQTFSAGAATGAAAIKSAVATEIKSIWLATARSRTTGDRAGLAAALVKAIDKPQKEVVGLFSRVHKTIFKILFGLEATAGEDELFDEIYGNYKKSPEGRKDLRTKDEIKKSFDERVRNDQEREVVDERDPIVKEKRKFTRLLSDDEKDWVARTREYDREFRGLPPF